MRKLLLLALLVVASPVNAGKNFDRAIAAAKEWRQCVIDASLRMADRAQPETVVEASFSVCEKAEGTFRHWLFEWSRPAGIGAGYDAAEMRKQVDGERRKIRAAALAAILSR